MSPRTIEEQGIGFEVEKLADMLAVLLRGADMDANEAWLLDGVAMCRDKLWQIATEAQGTTAEPATTGVAP